MNQKWFMCQFFDDKGRCPSFDEQIMQDWLHGMERAKISGSDEDVDKTLSLSLGDDVDRAFCSKCDSFEMKK